MNGTTQKSTLSGEFYMMMSVLGLSVMQILVRLLDETVTPWTVACFRSLFTVLFILIWMGVRGEKLEFRNWPLLLVRSLCGAVTITFFFWAIDLLGLFTATLYLYVNPVFSIIFAVLLFGDRYSFWILLPLASALAGLYLVVNPRFGDFDYGHIVGLVLAVIGGVARAALGQLRESDTPCSIVVLFMTVTSVVAAGGVALLPGQTWHFFPASGSGLSVPVLWIILGAIGLFSAFSHIAVTTSFHKLSTARASILSMSIVPLTAFVSRTLFHEAISPGTVVGAVLITAAGIGISFVPSPRRAAGE